MQSTYYAAPSKYNSKKKLIYAIIKEESGHTLGGDNNQKGAWWLILCVNWTGPQCWDSWSNIIVDVSVKVRYVGGGEYMYIGGVWVKQQITLHNMSGLYLIGWRLHWEQRLTFPKKENLPTSCLWSPTASLPWVSSHQPTLQYLYLGCYVLILFYFFSC